MTCIFWRAEEKLISLLLENAFLLKHFIWWKSPVSFNEYAPNFFRKLIKPFPCKIHFYTVLEIRTRGMVFSSGSIRTGQKQGSRFADLVCPSFKTEAGKYRSENTILFLASKAGITRVLMRISCFYIAMGWKLFMRQWPNLYDNLLRYNLPSIIRSFRLHFGKMYISVKENKE